MTPRVREILTWYSNENLEVLTQLTRVLNQGSLGGSGKLMFNTCDHSLDQGPRLSYHRNANGFDPGYHFRLAINTRVNALVAPQGVIESSARDFVGDIPYFMSLHRGVSVKSQLVRAKALGASGVAFDLEDPEASQWVFQEASRKGLLSLVHVGSVTALDEVCARVHRACLMGAHLIQCSMPQVEGMKPARAKYYNLQQIQKLENRMQHVLESALNGRRLLLVDFEQDLKVSPEVAALMAGGSKGLVVGPQLYLDNENEVMKQMKPMMDTMVGRIE